MEKNIENFKKFIPNNIQDMGAVLHFQLKNNMQIQLDFISPACDSIFQRNIQEISKHPNLILESIHPQYKRNFIKNLEEKKNFSWLGKIFTASGTQKHISIQATYTSKENQENSGYLFCIHDLSNFESMFLNNNESLQRIQFLKNEGSYIYLECTKNFSIIESFKSHLFTNYKNSELIGKNLLDYLADFDFETEYFNKSKTKFYSKNCVFLDKDKKRISVEVCVFPIYDTFNELKLLAIQIFNLNQICQLTDQLDLLKSKIYNSSKELSLGELSKGISHEINNPLAIIMALAEEMQFLSNKEKIKPEEITEFSTKISTNVQRIEKIVSGLSHFSNNFHKTDLSQQKLLPILDNCINLINYKLAKKQISIVKEISSPELKVICNANKLSQSLVQLIFNSAEAIQDLNEKWIKIKAYDENNYCFIEVIDSGKGIPLELQDKIMQEFFTSKNAQQKIGIGLNICNKLAEEQNAKIELINSHPNTCFRLSFPKN